MEDWLAEGRGEVELLAAVVDLVDGPEHPDLVTGAVEPVVAAVHGQGGQDPGEGGVPGQVHKAVLGVDLDVQRHHGALGQQASGGHEEAGGDAGHTEDGDRQSVELHSGTNLSARLCLLPSHTFTAASRRGWDKGFGRKSQFEKMEKPNLG